MSGSQPKAPGFAGGYLLRLAHSAVDIALWDICAKAASLPLWALLGGAKAGQEIRTYNTDIGWLHFSTSELIDNVARAMDSGWTGVKIKVGSPNPGEDVVRVGEIRRRFGDSLTIMVDGNEGWDFNTAMRWGKRLEDYDVYWFEEPIHADDVEGHGVLARELAIPIAVGENLLTRFAFRDYINAGAVEFLQPDVTRVGGITEWLKIADLADCWNLPAVPHVGDMMQVHQHLVGATQNSPMLEYVPWGREIFVRPANVRDGKLTLPSEPGASTDIRPDMMARYRVA